MVVLGTLTAAERTETWRLGEGADLHAPELDIGAYFGWILTFRADYVWKGTAPHFLEVELGRRHRTLTVGTTWLLYLADSNEQGHWVADPCSPYREASVRDVVEELGSYQTDLVTRRWKGIRDRLVNGGDPILIRGTLPP